jgi:transposase
VTSLVMDEFAIQKGHRYATVVVDPATRRVLWVGRGRSRESVRPFFTQLTESQRGAIQAVAMDMTAAYALEVQAHCPQARIVYDLFHVIAKYGREVIDRVRVDEANRLRGDKHARQVIKGSRWLLLRNREHMTREADQIRLEELLQANQALCKAYIMKDELKQLWLSRAPLDAWRRWKHWLRMALDSGIEALRHFAIKLKDYAAGIISHARYTLHTSVLEGINNTIKVIKRRAYGFRDDEYFFLKIKNAFPGIRR